ncbi:CRISPR-associated endoribonuclease Cas6 [Ferroplasma acidiphilum]|nr:CRISPR-associated endoribonuclease Cas6 [Ferroplasma acidiphilum]
MKSTKLYIKRVDGKIIPFEYNYFIGISIYKKLLNFQEDIIPLHRSSQIGIYTFSNIISPFIPRSELFADNGLNIDKGYIIFRTLNEKLIDYLRLGILQDNKIRIKDTVFEVSRIEDIKPYNGDADELKFKSLSPILVRDYIRKKIYVNDEQNVAPNLKLVIENQLSKFFGINSSSVNFSDLTPRKKSIRISSNGKKESISTGFNLSGTITAQPDILKLLYYKGLGSKTSLGLGCWEVVK